MSTSITDPETSAPPAPPKPHGKSKTFSADPSAAPKWKGGRSLAGLTPLQAGLAIVILLLWLHLFAGGMLVDTQPYRCAISWSALAEINPKTINDHPCNAFWIENDARTARVFSNRYGVPQPAGGANVVTADAAGAAATPAATTPLPVQPVPFGEMALPWLLTILFFTPLNLAFVAAAAGALGGLGAIANLDDDSDTNETRDRTNPLVSGLLRGMFVYLFVISGMLLFDDSPFSATGPDQYVRLAGFLSLFSFVVNYQPKVFSNLLDWANTRIQTRNNAGAITQGRQGEIVRATAAPGGEARVVNRTVSVTEAVVEQPEEGGDARPARIAGADGPSRNGHSNGNGPGGFGG